MSTNIKNLGWWKADNEIAPDLNKVVLPTSAGTTIVVIPDSNAPETATGYGDETDTDVVRVFEVNADFTSAVEVATITTGNLDWPGQLSADLYSDNSIGIVYHRNNDAVTFRKVTYGTWAVAAAETVATIPTANLERLDISVSDGNVPAVGWIKKNGSNPKCEVEVYTRKTSTSTWVVSRSQALVGSAAPNMPMSDLALQWVKGGTATARGLVFAAASAEQAGADFGTRLYHGIVDESTGTMVNTALKATLLAGSMTTKWGAPVRKVSIFPSGTNEITVAVMEAADKKNLLIARYTWNGTTWAESMPPQMSQASNKNLDRLSRFATSYAADVVNFYFTQEVSGVLMPVNYLGAIDRLGPSVRYSGPFKFDNGDNNQDRIYPLSGTGRFAYSTTEHGVVFFNKNANNNYQARVQNVKTAPAPVSVTPAAGSSATSGTPIVSLRANLALKFPQSKHKAIWQIASDPGFTTAVRTYEQSDEKFTVLSNTEGANYVYISDTIPPELAMTSGNWYIRAALVDEFGIVGTWSPGQQFTISHPPVAINLTPDAGQVLVGGDVTFNWDFTDPSPTDVQTAYQLIVENNDTGAVILDTGKVPGAITSHLATISNTYTGILLRWHVGLWDSDDVPGPLSEYETFAVAAPPTVVIDAPAPAATVPSGTPTVLFTPTVGDGRRIKKYQVLVMQGGVTVRNSGMVAVDSISGTQIVWRSPMPLLDNGAGYSVQVLVVDNTGMTGVSATHTFSVDAVAPASSSDLIINGSGYNTEGQGYISVSWDDDNRDEDFESWVVSRRDNMLDLNFNIVETGEWKIIDEVTETESLYEYRDYYAPSGYQVEYKVQQMVNRSGDRAISQGDPVQSTIPISEGYWIIQPVDNEGFVSAFRLHNVTGDDYTDEHEEAEVNVLGRGRHVDRGDHLGIKGSLQAKLRDGHGTSARQKKIQLETARASDTAVYLRNPFGDVWQVNLGNIGINRLAGVGRSEFVDVTVPYSEVDANDDQ